MVRALIDRLPVPLHRLLLRGAQAVRLAVWGLLRREVRGCNALVFDPQGRVLLVRHSYHRSTRWLLPGGGLARGEDPAETGMREVLEETGCAVADAVWYATDLRRMPGGWRNRIELVGGTTRDTPRADGREILEAAFFPTDSLPLGTGHSVPRALALWRARSEG